MQTHKTNILNMVNMIQYLLNIVYTKQVKNIRPSWNITLDPED